MGEGCEGPSCCTFLVAFVVASFITVLLEDCCGIKPNSLYDSVGEAVSGEGSAGPVALAMAGLAALAALTIVAVTIRRRRHASANAQGVEHVPLAESDEETEAETPKGSALSEEEREKLTASV